MMQAIRPALSQSPSLNCYSTDECVEISAKFSEDFSGNLKLNVSDDKTEQSPDEYPLEDEPQSHHEAEEEEEEENDEDDFSFACSNPDVSPIAADDIFCNGQIRPIFPIFNRDLLFADGHDGDSKPSSKKASALRPPLRKLFVEDRNHPSSSETDELDAAAAGPYCAWSRKAVDTSPDSCKKSNSTGFSKLWRFRDILNRSSSDGKDAFVFLDPSATTKREDKVEKAEVSREKSSNSGEAKVVAGKAKGKKGVKGETASSAHEIHYVRNRALKEGDRRRSYLPYRQDLVGFFTNVNGLSRNVHPF